MPNNRTITIRYSSKQALNSLSRRLTTGLPSVAKDVVSKGCMAIEADAKKNAPVRTGRMRDGIYSKIESNNEGAIGRVISPVIYSPYVEFGTSKMPAKPFMKPAMDANKEDIINYSHEKLKELIRG